MLFYYSVCGIILTKDREGGIFLAIGYFFTALSAIIAFFSDTTPASHRGNNK